MSTLGTFAAYANFAKRPSKRQEREAEKRAKRLGGKTAATSYEVNTSPPPSGETKLPPAKPSSNTSTARPAARATSTQGSPAQESPRLNPAQPGKRRGIVRQPVSSVTATRTPPAMGGATGSKQPVSPKGGALAKYDPDLAKPDYFKQVKKNLRNRNILIGSGLGLAGLGTLGAIAYNNRNSNKRAEMSGLGHYANFDYYVSPQGVVNERTPEQSKAARASAAKRKKVVDSYTKTGSPEADAVIKNTRDTLRKARQKRIGEVNKQLGFERMADRGNPYTDAKGGEYIARTLAAAGSPERDLIARGKSSQNGFVKTLAEGAENFGKLGYKKGAVGLGNATNALVGRTVTGKLARLGVAGVGLSAIGGAMKRNRQERG